MTPLLSISAEEWSDRRLGEASRLLDSFVGFVMKESLIERHQKQVVVNRIRPKYFMLPLFFLKMFGIGVSVFLSF